MIRPIHPLIPLAFAICGCAGEPPIQAAWYYFPVRPDSNVTSSTNTDSQGQHCKSANIGSGVESASTSSATPSVETYLAILNQEDHAIDITKVAINMDSKQKDSGWTMEVSCPLLQSGNILLLPVHGFRDQTGKSVPYCVVPVSLEIWTPEEPQHPLTTPVIGGLPSAAPSGWQQRCGVLPESG